MKLPGDAREHYIARLQWADAGTLLIQQMNRFQNTVSYLLADAATGAAREMWRDRDDAFITIGFGGLPEAASASQRRPVPRHVGEGRLDARLPGRP